MVKAKLLEAQTDVGHDEPGEKNGDTHSLLDRDGLEDHFYIRPEDTARVYGTKRSNETPKARGLNDCLNGDYPCPNARYLL